MKKIDVTLSCEIPSLVYPYQECETVEYFVAHYVGSSFRIKHRCRDYAEAMDYLIEHYESLNHPSVYRVAVITQAL